MNKFGRLCGIGVCALLFALAGCGGHSQAGGGTGSTNPAPGAGQNTNQVVILPGQATPSSVTIQQGQVVMFTVQTGNPTETLCLGSNKQCASSPSGPQALDFPPGMQVRSGSSQSVTFHTAGTYQVTSLSYAGINITVTVK